MGVQILTVSIRNSWKWKAIQGRVRASLYYREVAVMLTCFQQAWGEGGLRSPWPLLPNPSLAISHPCQQLQAKNHPKAAI
jgi:hypothetical protein